MEVTPDPYIITFDKEADGGPIHLLHLLQDYCLRFQKNGEIVAEGRLTSVDYDNHTIRIEPIVKCTVLDIAEFDEVIYL